MILEFLIALFIGVFLGSITGITPGIHLNLVSVIIFSLSPILLNYTSPFNLVLVICSMAITHTFLDTIPSIFLGAPEEATALSVLPGHKLLLEGRGFEAVILTVMGSLGSLFLSIILFPILALLINYIYPIISSYIGYLLIFAVVYLIYKESHSKIEATFIFFLSGILGIAVLNQPNLKEPLFPLLSGLFGTSTLFLSLKSQTKIPQQIISWPILKIKDTFKVLFASTLTGSFGSIMPGLGPSQAAILASSFFKKMTPKEFLILVGGLSTVNMVVSFLTLYLINKSRNGAVVVIAEIIGTITLKQLAIISVCSILAAILSTILVIIITKKFSELISKVNYSLLCLVIMLFIILLTPIISGKIGLLVLLTSTFVGILPSIRGIGKNHLMGCLLLPVIFYFTL